MSHRSLALLALLVLVTAGVSAQSNPSQYGEEVAVSYVMVPFTVLGAKGVPLTDLAAAEVSLLVDGKPVPTDMFELSRNAPVSWTILLDGSGSMGLAGKLEAAKAAINALTARRQEGDDFALFVFDSEGHANELVPFTENPAAITRAVDVVKPWGKTAFFDALSEMPERSELGRNSSRAIVLLSDGIDNASKLKRADIERKLEGVAIPIYAFSLRDPIVEVKPKKKAAVPVSEDESNIDLLAELASATGGKLFVGNQPEQLASAMNGIESVLRAQYLIGFPPTGKGTIKYRRISLKTAGRVRSVRVRAGYRGTEPPVQSAAARGPKRKNERKNS
ncbi:MAG: Ca-activated chloride channel [Acidobacteriota bacterium]|jgi:Ca-activated chloride channel family protein|nr:Ca-activated chloride channel [Acidobacteriota bacterium]